MTDPAREKAIKEIFEAMFQPLDDLRQAVSELYHGNIINDDQELIREAAKIIRRIKQFIDQAL